MKKICGIVAVILAISMALTAAGCSKAEQLSPDEALSASGQREEIGAGDEAPALEASDVPAAEVVPQESEGASEDEDAPQSAASTSVDIWDYIDGDEWDYYGMAADMGWQRDDYELNVLSTHIAYARVTLNCPGGVPDVLDPNSEADRRIRTFSIDCAGGVSDKCYAMFGGGTSQEVAFSGAVPEKCYTVVGRTDGLRVPMEEIVITAIYLDRLGKDSKNDAADLLQIGSDLSDSLAAVGAVQSGGGIFAVSCQ